MAPFNKYIPTTEENYLGYSKGVDAPKPNLALAKLFSGMGDLVNEGVHGGTQLLDIKLENEAEKAGKGLNQDVSMSLEDAATLGKFKNKVDTGAGSTLGGSPEPVGSSQVSSGSGGATTLAEGGENAPATPVEVQKGLSTLDNLYTLYQQGKLSPTYWMTRQQMVVQQLKARFPGSEAQIDQAIHRVTQPANQIRNQVFADFQAAATAANSANKDWEHYVRSKAEFLGSDGINKALSPEVYNNKSLQIQVTSEIAQQEKIQQDRKAMEADITLKRSQNALTTEDAEHAFLKSSQGIVTGGFKGAFSSLGGLQDWIDKKAATGKFEPEDIAAAGTALTEMRRAAETQVDQLITLYGPTIRDPGKIAAMRKEALEPFDRVSKSLGMGDMPLTTWHADYAKRRTEIDQARLLEMDPVARWMAANKGISDQNFISQQIRNWQVPAIDPKTGLKTTESALSRFWKDSNTIFFGNMAGKANPDTNIGEVSKSRDNAPGVKKDPPASVVRDALKNAVNVITTPSNSNEMKSNAVDYITKDTQGNFFKNLDKPSQFQAFNTLTAPDITSSIKNLPDQDKWTSYKTWGQNIFNSMTMARAGDIQTLVNSNKLTYNPTTNQLEVGKPFPNVAGERYPEKETLDQINNSLRNIGNINSLDKTDPATSMTPLFRGLKVPVQQPTTGTGKRSSVEGGNLSRLAYAPEGNNSENPLANIGGGEGFSSVSSSRVAAISKLPINSTVESVADKHDFDANALKAIIHIESSGKPTATTGKYKGLMQLSNEEFSRYGRKGGSIYNAADNVEAGVKSLKAKQAWFEDRVGRSPSITELYLIHQQGPGGLLAHERNPDAPAWENMYSTAEGQHRGPTWAKKAIWGNVPTDMKREFGSVDNITSADFIKMWEAKLRGKTSRG